METIKRSVVARGYGVGEGRMAEHGGILGIENTLYDTIVRDTCNYTFV